MKHVTLLPALVVSLALVACVDTTGLSKESSRPAKGNVNSAVVVVEFADLQCPACKAASTRVVEPLLAKYSTQVRFEFAHFPLRTAHRYAQELAESAECAADQGKFWEFVSQAFERQEMVTQNGSNEIKGIAQGLMLDMDLFGRCVRSHIKKDTVAGDYEQGVSQGVTGTPTFFVNGTKVEADVEKLSAAIDQALTGAASRL